MKRKASAIMVANTAKLDRKRELAHYGCNDCGNSTIVQASMESPYCAHCGSGNLVASEQASVKGKMLLRAEDSELANVKCPGCSSHLVMTLATASSHVDSEVGHIHCPACATEIAFKAPEVVADDDEWVEEQSEAESDPEDVLALDETDIDTDDETEHSEEDEVDAEESARVRRRGRVRASVEDEPESADEPESEEPVSDPEPEAVAESVEETDEEHEQPVATEEPDTEEKAEPTHIPATEPVTLALHTLATEKATFSVDGARLLCWQGDLVTAVRAVAAGENPTALAGALTRAVETNPLGAVLSQNGFNVLTVTASADAVVAQEVERKRAELDAVVEADLQSLGERVHQSLGIATCGLNRGFFNRENPMAAALVKRMVAAGLDAEHAEELVADAMNECGDEFASVLRELTMDIVGKHEDVRNELASTIMTVRKPKTTKAVASVVSPLEQALSRPLKRSAVAEVASADDAPKPRTRVEALAQRGGLFSTHTRR